MEELCAEQCCNFSCEVLACVVIPYDYCRCSHYKLNFARRLGMKAGASFLLGMWILNEYRQPVSIEIRKELCVMVTSGQREAHCKRFMRNLDVSGCTIPFTTQPWSVGLFR